MFSLWFSAPDDVVSVCFANYSDGTIPSHLFGERAFFWPICRTKIAQKRARYSCLAIEDTVKLLRVLCAISGFELQHRLNTPATQRGMFTVLTDIRFPMPAALAFLAVGFGN